MSNQIQKVTVKALFRQNGRFLFVHDGANWELPGGKVEFGEHPLEALSREIKEELNLDDFKIGKIVHVWDFVSEYEAKDCQFIVLVYSCEANLSNVKLSDEHSEFVWIDPKELDRFQMRDGYRETVRAYAL